MDNKIFEYAKSKGIESLELYISEAEEIEINIFHGEIDNYKVAKDKCIYARGIYQGKMGYASSEKDDANTAKVLVNSIINNAKIITSPDKGIIYPGDKEYGKVNVYNERLNHIPMNMKIDLLLEMEKKALAYNPLIAEVADCAYSESNEIVTIINDKGLNLTRKNNQIFCYLSVVARKGEENRDGSYFIFDNNFDHINSDIFVKKACDEALEKIGSGPIKSGAYKVVMDAKMTAALMSFVIGNCYASNVQDGLSKFADKLGERIANNNITIIEDPLQEGSISSTPFDDEGVATKKKVLVDKGILKMFLYNLKRAAKGNTETTGNGYRMAGNVGISIRNAYLQGGDKSKEDLFTIVNDGLYITELNGLHSGLDAISGNFSLQAAGFVIKDGKKGQPVSVITVAGNLYDMLNNIELLGNDLDFAFNPNIKAPSVIVNGLVVAGL